MKNILSYAEETKDSFSATAFNPVDSLILSWVSYLHLPTDIQNLHNWHGVHFSDLFCAEYFEEMFCDIWDKESTKKLFAAMAASPRYRDIIVAGYTEHFDTGQEKQFAAVSFQLTKDLCYIAFRGTNSTLVGWKEDFNMAFQYPVPSQKDALLYLSEAALHCTGKIRVGGHSKGGNLAVYAAANSKPDVNARIEAVYSHDGPGFLKSALESENFINISDRIDKTIPQSSLVGLLLEQQENYRIIKSSKLSFWQHDPFSWVVEGNDFQHSDSLTPNARYLDHTISEWLESLSCDERELFVNSLYELISIENITTFAQLRSNWRGNLPSIVLTASKQDPATRKFLLQTVKKLFTLSAKTSQKYSARRLNRANTRYSTIAQQKTSRNRIYH